MKMAIVGASEEKWSEDERSEAKMMIYYKLLPKEGITLISGGSPKGGVDIWAEQCADAMKIPKQIFKPEVEQWEDKVTDGDGVEVHGKITDPIKEQLFIRKGYKSRNIQIAEACDILYCFSPGKLKKILFEKDVISALTDEVWNGGIWTANRAEELGKKVIRVAVHAEKVVSQRHISGGEK